MLQFLNSEALVETFGEWLRRQRTHRHLTRVEFATRVGCSVSTLRKIEDDERRPSSQIAELIASALDIPSADRETFQRVARGELGTNRLSPVPSPTQLPNISLAESIPPRTNLPVLPTPLIGRQHEIDELMQLLKDPHCRMVTCVGPGGIGKTRLAIETATQLQNEFADGVFFVPLASANSASFIVPMIADSLGFRFQNTVAIDPKDQLRDYLKEKQLLLLMDNMEHLLRGSEIEWFSELTELATSLKILFTSREPLNLQSEWIFEVHGLAIPETPGSTETMHNTSIELFLQRARRAHVGFNATTNEYPAIVRICQLLDGMPLGIELAAAWVRTLSCEEIEKEIQRNLDFLSLASRDLPTRHRSMRAVFDHSWQLLLTEERTTLAYLSTFRGGFTREAAEQVAGTALNTISALISKSLIQRREEGRYDLHELIRQFASAKLEEDQHAQTEVLTKHSSYYLALLSQRETRLKSPAQGEVLKELRQEIGNIRNAWYWALAQKNFALIASATQCLWVFYDIAGWFDESGELAQRTIEVLEQTTDLTQNINLGGVLAWQGFVFFRTGQYQKASAVFSRSLSLLRLVPLDIHLPQTLIQSAIIIYRMGDLETADTMSAEALTLSRKIKNEWLTAWAACLRGIIINLRGNPELAYQYLSEGLAGFRKTGDPRLTAYALNFISPVAIALQRSSEAEAFLKESLAIGQQLDDHWGTATSYCNLGLAAQTHGDYAVAQTYIKQGLSIFKDLGARGYIAEFMNHLGNIQLALGEFATASEIFRETIRVALEVQSLPVALDAMTSLAQIQAQQDESKALETLLVVLNHSATIPATQTRAQSLSTEIQNRLSPLQIETIKNLISSLSFEEFVMDLFTNASERDI